MAERQNLYDAVTTRIIGLLEQGVKPWSMPFTAGSPRVPSNIANGTVYRGINTVLLWMTAAEAGYPRHQWLTFKQANGMGARIRKGEKASPVVYVSKREVEDDKGEKRLQTFLKSYSVFNVAQVDNLPAALLIEHALPEDERLHRLDALAKATGITITYGAPAACYRPNRDVVEMPAYGQFRTDDGFAATLCHELAHATGHPDRLNRRFGKRFGDELYATEEVTAEMSSSFMCAHLGFQHEHDSAAYIGHWIKVMKSDSRAVFTVASQASKAADWLLECEHAVTKDTPECERQPAEEELEMAM
jgi:antirestriction protein ArdC